MELLYTLVGFNLASTLFTLFEVIRLESLLDQMVRSLTVVSDEEENQEGGNSPKTFM